MAKPEKDNLIGSTLDRKYEITGVLGEGGMGTVYAGQHVHLKRKCAVKVVRRTLASDPIALKRFKLEAEAASMLKHPNIIEIYDFGITEDELPYIVMEFLPGQSLDDVLERQKCLHYEEALSIFIPVCDALAHAHDKKVLHRDLKPANIMLIEQENGENLVKLVDFGIAKLLPGTGRAIDKMTQTGEVFGSPLYMSPEQCMGQALDIRSDVYALGCVFYETLTGKLPFDGETLFSIIMQHVNDPPRSFTDINPDIAIPDELEDIVLQCMSKEKELRFSTVGAVRKKLARIYTSMQFKSTKPANTDAPEADPPEPSKEQQAENLGESGTVKINRDAGKSLRRDFKVDSENHEREIDIDKNSREAPEDNDFDPASESEETLLAEINRCERAYGKDHRSLIDPLSRIFWIYEMDGDLERALRTKQRILKLTRTYEGENCLDYAYCLQDLARISLKQENAETAESLYAQCIQIKTKFMDKDCKEVCLNFIDYAGALEMQKRTAEATDTVEQALLAIYRSSGRNSDAAEVEYAAGHFYFCIGDYESAFPHYLQTFEIRKELSDFLEKDLREPLIYLASCKDRGNEHDIEEAITYCQQILRINEKNPSCFDEFCAEPYRILATCYYSLKKLKEAEAACFKAMKLYEELNDEDIYTDAFYWADTCKTLSNIYLDMGRFAESERYRKKAKKLHPSSS